MTLRRLVLQKLGAIVGMGLLGSTKTTAQSDPPPSTVTITNEETEILSLDSNPDFEGDTSEFITSNNDSVTVTANLNPDAQTGLINILIVVNESENAETFSLIDETDVGERIDIRTRSTSVVVESADAGGIVELEPDQQTELSVIFDLEGVEAKKVNGDFTLNVGGENDTGNGNNNGSGCVITTATASDPATLQSLRRFRDGTMSTTIPGRMLLSLYYRLGSPVAETLERHPNSRTRQFVRRVVRSCARLADAQEQRRSRPTGALISIVLILVYAVGGVIGLAGHMIIRLRELIRL